MYIIDFLPPVIGVDSEFNTFRLGMKWYSLVQPGDKVIVCIKATHCARAC